MKKEARDLQVIFVDDGSDMKHRMEYETAFKKYGDLNITYCFLGEKDGKNRVCAARNKGVELSENENLVFIDQETILPKSYLHHIQKHTQNESVVIGPYFWYNNRKKALEENDVDFFIRSGFIDKEDFEDFRMDFYREKQENGRL